MSITSPARKSPALHAEKSLRSDRMTGKQPLCRGGHHAGGKAADRGEIVWIQKGIMLWVGFAILCAVIYLVS